MQRNSTFLLITSLTTQKKICPSAEKANHKMWASFWAQNTNSKKSVRKLGQWPSYCFCTGEVTSVIGYNTQRDFWRSQREDEKIYCCKTSRYDVYVCPRVTSCIWVSGVESIQISVHDDSWSVSDTLNHHSQNNTNIHTATVALQKYG